ncbi:MAG: DUF2231 domain-containing protein [Thermoplasmatota archaeon]
MPAFPPPVLHPIVHHLPIVLLPLAALLATVASAYVPWRTWLAPAGALLLLVAVAGAGAAYLTGDAAQSHARQLLAANPGAGNKTASPPPRSGAIFGAARPDLEMHKTLAAATLWASLAVGALGVWQRKRIFSPMGLWAWPALLWILAVLVIATAWYGGALVYEHGLGIPHPA